MVRPAPDLLARPAVCGHPTSMILTRAPSRAPFALVVKITPGPQACSRAPVGSPASTLRSDHRLALAFASGWFVHRTNHRQAAVTGLAAPYRSALRPRTFAPPPRRLSLVAYASLSYACDFRLPHPRSSARRGSIPPCPLSLIRFQDLGTDPTKGPFFKGFALLASLLHRKKQICQPCPKVRGSL